MEPEFDVERFEKKLLNLKDTQDSITGLSKWCLSKRTAHKQVVRSWLNVLKQVKIESRLTLFYLANDVIQHSKRRNYEFVDSWGTTLQKATTLVRDDKVKEKISRIFNIWEQREIYSEDFIADLHGLLAINPGKKSTSITPASSIRSLSPIVTSHQPSKTDDFEEEFQLSSVVSGIRSCVSLESETDKNLKIVVKAQVPDMEKTRNNLKDRTHVDEVEKDIENATIKYDAFITSLNAEITARKLLLTALDQADRFYRNQRRDVKKVVYAYKNFGERIKQIQSELNAKIPNLTSPIPSPDINAPSPEPDNDFDLPGDINFYNSNMNGFGSFLNNDAPLPFDVNEFYRDSPPQNVDQNSIQVIHSQDPTAPLSDFYSSLIPPKLEAYNPEMNYAGSYQPSQPPLPPPMSNYQNNPMPSYMVAPPLPPASYNPSQIDYSSEIPLPPSMDTSADDYNNWNNWNSTPVETPHSPPHFERKGHGGNVVEYIDDSLRTITDSNDVDHRQLMMGRSDSDGGGKDVDHRNLISLTGSPGPNKDADHRLSTNGNEQFLPLDPPPTFKFLSECIDVSKPPNFNRNQRPPLLPTPAIPRYNRNMSMNSDSSRGMNGPDDIESVDMEMSDDDTGMDNRSVGSSGDHRDFSMQNMFPLPHQVNMNRPPPPLMPENDINQQRKAWIHNESMLSDDGSMNQMPDTPPSLLGIAPPNFLSPNHRGNFQGNFRGNRGGAMIRGNNNSPFSNFRGGRGNNRARGRGGFRGNFKGQNQW